MLLNEHISLLTESVSINEINDAIDNHVRIIINYRSKGEDIANGARVIEVYAYGLTKAGNPVIRSWQPYGDTTSRTPAWKFFRLDRITYWKPTRQVFTEPASVNYKGYGDFNPNGDGSMSVVYKIAKFDGTDNNEISKPINHSSPKMKYQEVPQQDTAVYKTDTEKNMARLKQQLDNPIKLSDIKTKQGFKQYNDNNTQKAPSGPRMKHDITSTPDNTKDRNVNNMPQPTNADNVTTNAQNNNNDVFKTDTERSIERLRQQLQNPRKIDLSKIPRR